jgi:hypothetical protein
MSADYAYGDRPVLDLIEDNMASKIDASKIDALDRAAELAETPDDRAAIAAGDDRVAQRVISGISLQRIGPSYQVEVRAIGARFVFRDVRTDRDLSADVSVSTFGRHLFRSTVTLSLTGRNTVAKTAADLSGGYPALADWKAAAHAATEAVLEAEEQLGSPVDLRTASLELPAGGMDVARPLWPVGSMALLSPGDAGKSTLSRALAVSLASGMEVIPGVAPIGAARPVLYVAAEDPVALWHARSIEAICRGIGIERTDLAQPIELYDTHGRPLHRIARAIAERAADFGAVMLDSQQALLPVADAAGGIRDRDSLFWHAVDQLQPPTLIVAHPNRSDARDWSKADGRMAGSEVNRDRSRMAWKVTWKDEAAIVGQSFRRYTLHNVKNNHGPKQPPFGFSAHWQFGIGADPGTVQFTASDPFGSTAEEGALSAELSEALKAYEGGATSAAPLAQALSVPYNTAKSRLRLLRGKGLIGGSDHDA